MYQITIHESCIIVAVVMHQCIPGVVLVSKIKRKDRNLKEHTAPFLSTEGIPSNVRLCFLLCLFGDV